MKLTKKTVGSYIGFTVVGLLFGIMLMLPMSTNAYYQVVAGESLHEAKPANLQITITRANGSVEQIQIHNLVVTIGKTRARDLLLGSATNPTNATIYISMSNDASPGAAWTKLPNEITNSGVARAVGTSSILNATAFQSVKVFQATTTVTVQCAGLNWSPTINSDNNLFGAAAFTQTTLNNLDQISMTWVINLSSTP